MINLKYVRASEIDISLISGISIYLVTKNLKAEIVRFEFASNQNCGVMLFAILFLLIISNTFAQDCSEVTVSATCKIVNVTPEEALHLALQDARQQAIRAVVGVRVSEHTTRLIEETVTGQDANEFKDVFSKFSRSTSYGKIIKENYTETKGIDGDDLTVTVALTACVAEEKEDPDPQFRVEIVSGKSVYYASDKGKPDEIIFEIRATQDCYLYVFNIYANNNVQLILPNRDSKNNFFKYGAEEQQWEIEKKKLRQHYWVGLPRGIESANEGLFVVALKEPLDFKSDKYISDYTQTLPTYRAALEEIMQWLIQLPANKRCDSYTPIFIKKRH